MLAFVNASCFRRRSSLLISGLAFPAFLFLFGILAITAVARTGMEAWVEDVSGTNYVGVVQRELQAATNSVVVAMFEMRVPDDPDAETPSLVLVNELIAAHRRGVDVKVVLNLRSRYDPESDEPVRDHANGVAADMLAYAGIDVSYCPSTYHMHEKLVVIDRETVIIGSHNWTYSGLLKNVESSSLIRSREHAKSKLAGIAELETVSASISVAPAVAEKVPIPRGFLLRPGLAPQMTTRNDQRPFDAYLLLCWYSDRDGTENTFSVNLQRLAADLGIDPAKGPANSRKLAIRPLRSLADHYGLIDLTIPRAADAQVTMRHDSTTNADGFIQIPSAYWTYGLSTELKQAEKMAYLICLNEETQALIPPIWMKSQPDLAEKYSISRNPINIGLNGLQRHDLLSIIRSPISANNYKKRRPNQYRLRPLLSPEERATRWLKLETKHSPLLVTQARELATLLDYGNDFTSADQLATAIAAYGFQTASNVTAQVATKSVTNPNRHPDTVATYLHNTRRDR